MDEKCLEDRTKNPGRSFTLYEDEKPTADIDVDRIRACRPHLRSYTAARADVYLRDSLDRLAPGNGSSDCIETQVPGLKDIPELDNNTDLTKEWTICSMAYRTRSQHSLTPVYTDEMHNSAFLSLCNLASSSWTLGAAECSHHSHYRLIINDIGRSLASFCCTKEVVRAIADARTAHECAFYTAGITHRSISAGNILIASDGTGGLLVDWDVSLCLLDDRETPRTRQLRMGMWQFMSIRLLRERPADQEDCELLANDMESLFWVLLYVILRFFPQKELPPATVRNQVKRIFEEVLWLSSLDDIQGGRNKLDFLHHLVLEHQLAKYNFIYKLPAHIQNILRSLAAIFHDFYFGSHSPADIDELQKAEVIYPKLDREFRAMLSTDDWSNHETENTFDLFARHSEEELSS